MNSKRALARIFGNFGIAFFSPLVGGNIADTIFNVNMTFYQMMIIAVISATFTTGLAVSKEIAEYGKKW